MHSFQNCPTEKNHTSNINVRVKLYYWFIFRYPLDIHWFVRCSVDKRTSLHRMYENLILAAIVNTMTLIFLGFTYWDSKVSEGKVTCLDIILNRTNEIFHIHSEIILHMKKEHRYGEKNVSYSIHCHFYGSTYLYNFCRSSWNNFHGTDSIEYRDYVNIYVIFVEFRLILYVWKMKSVE
jgi:hypothetical protein